MPLRLGFHFSRRPPILALSTLLACSACGGAGTFHPSTPADVTAAGNPLGPSYILVPLPNDDDALLGRVLLDLPEQGRSLDEVSRPNECADKLTPKKEGPLASTFEDGQELAAGGKASAALGAFGFEGDASRATHFYYKLDVSKRSSQTDTTDYVACCKEKGSCGYGFISALIYGDGTYATAEEDNASGNLEIPVGGGVGGYVNAKILHKRNVHGYVAALVTVTDQNQSKKSNVLGDPAAAGITLTEENLPAQVKERFEQQKVALVDPSSSATGPIEFAYNFADGNGPITENEFVRRYGALAGHDLDGAEQGRRNGVIWAGAGVFALGTTITVLSFLNLKSSCSPDDSTMQVSGCSAVDTTSPPAGYVKINQSDVYYDPNATHTNGAAIVFGVTGILTAATGAVIALVGWGNYDGAPDDHSLSKYDAALYVAKYNRTLLKKTIDETKDRMRELSSSLYPSSRTTSFELKPVVSPGFTGIMGRF